MGVAAGHSADDEANVLRQMSLRPLNAELSSGTSRPLVREQQMEATARVRSCGCGESGHLPLHKRITLRERRECFDVRAW